MEHSINQGPLHMLLNQYSYVNATYTEDDLDEAYQQAAWDDTESLSMCIKSQQQLKSQVNETNYWFYSVWASSLLFSIDICIV